MITIIHTTATTSSNSLESRGQLTPLGIDRVRVPSASRRLSPGHGVLGGEALLDGIDGREALLPKGLRIPRRNGP